MLKNPMKMVCNIFLGGHCILLDPVSASFFQIITPHHPRDGTLPGIPNLDSIRFFPPLGKTCYCTLHPTHPPNPVSTCVDIQGNDPCQSRDEYHPILKRRMPMDIQVEPTEGQVNRGCSRGLVSPKKIRPAISGEGYVRWGGVGPVDQP